MLKNKVAIITGGASGIGRATAILFAQKGAAVSIIDINQMLGEITASGINASGGRAIFIPCNVAQAVDCKTAIGKTVETFGGLDILFNNAGIIRRTNILTITEEDWDLVMDVNVKSIFLMSRHAIPHMEKRGGGSIINTSSGW